MSNTDFHRKFRYDDPAAIGQFIKYGYVVYEDVYDAALIRESRDCFLGGYSRLLERSVRENLAPDVNGWAVSIIENYTKTDLYEQYVSTRKIVEIMKNYLGPDIAILGYDALWINVPQDADPVLLKGDHTDAWTGTSVNSIFAKTFFTDVDDYNGMGVCPGSHLQGMIPVRNRAIDPLFGVEFESVNLNQIRQGDLLIWHPLLIHSTVGHSDRNIRISVTSRYTSTETPFSSQERALGYRTLNVGPMNQVMRLIGNDLLNPFRTYGGHVGIDRRLARIYEYGDYVKNIDYTPFLK